MVVKRFSGIVTLFGLALVCICALWVLGIPITGAHGSVNATIQSMIDAAPDGGTVIIPNSGVVYLESLTVTKNITLVAQTRGNVTVVAPAGQRIITVIGNKTLRLVDLALNGGNPSGDVGGAIKAEGGRLEVYTTRIYSCTAEYGGAIFQSGSNGIVVLYASQFDHNHARFDGGALYISGRTVISYPSIINNSADRHGGAIHFAGSLIDVYSGNFYSNTAGLNGGAINADNSVSISGTLFSGNTAGQDGGALLQWNGPLTYTVCITNARFQRNVSQRDGGAIYVAQGAATTLSNTMVLTNTAKRNGGGLGLEGGILTILGSTFGGNSVDSGSTSPPQGGGVYLSGTITVRSSIFYSNSYSCNGCAYSIGGGMYTHLLQAGSILDSEFMSNTAWFGAGLYSDGSSLLLERDTFRSNGGTNRSGYGAGADLTNSPNATIMDCVFSMNNAFHAGGGLRIGFAKIERTLFISNTSGVQGGALAGHGDLSINQSWFINNVTSRNEDGGGGLYNSWVTRISNTLFVSNSAGSGSGAAIYFKSTGSPGQQSSIVFSTISNPGMSPGSAIYQLTGTLRVTDTIITSHTIGISQTGGILYYISSLMYSTFTDFVYGGTLTTTGFFVDDPHFANPGIGDYRLASNSPAINAGLDLGVVEDLDGRRRPVGAGYDTGAYEFSSDVVLPMVLKN
jgi:predicted outer membrane repeat protein